MAQKRKSDQSKFAATAALLKKLEKETARRAKPLLSDNWRDNLFEIIMTRLDLIKPHKKTFENLTISLRKEPQKIPEFAKLFLKSMRHMLALAQAPAHPPAVAALTILYMNMIHSPAQDDAKQMALLDQRLGLFEKFLNFNICPKK